MKLLETSLIHMGIAFRSNDIRYTVSNFIVVDYSTDYLVYSNQDQEMLGSGSNCNSGRFSRGSSNERSSSDGDDNCHSI